MREEDQGDEQQERPPRKRRRGAYDGEKLWGTLELEDKNNEKISWLKNDDDNENEEQSVLQFKQTKQTKIRVWTLPELISRELVLETFDLSWQALEDKVELQHEGEVQGAEEGGDQVGEENMIEVMEQEASKSDNNNKSKLNHDIRIMIKNQKYRAAARREDIRRGREEELILTLALVATEEQEKKREAREQRQRRAKEQKECLLNDIKTKTEEAKIRLLEKLAREKDKEIAKERRLSKARVEKLKTLEKIHMMDWEKTELMEEGKGLCSGVVLIPMYTLVVGMSGTQERKRKRGKKLRWSSWARERAAVGGKVARRMVVKAKRRLEIIECEQEYEWWDMEVEEEKQASVLSHDFEESMHALRIDEKETEMENVEEAVRLMTGLQLGGAGLRPWESKEHQWVKDIDTTNDEEKELIQTPWFDWGEEKREHWEIEKLLQRLSLSGCKEEPEPSSQAKILCGQCGSWLRLDISNLRVDLTEDTVVTTAVAEPCAWTRSRARAREPLMSTCRHAEQEHDNNQFESNLYCVQDMREAGHGPGEPGEQDPLPQPQEHGHDVGDGDVACAPVGLDGPAGEDEMVIPAGDSREHETIGRKLEKITTLSGDQKSLMTTAMSQGEQELGVEVVKPVDSLSGTSDVTGVVAREVERLNLLVNSKEEDPGIGRKGLRVVKVAGRGRSKAKKKEGEMECSRIEDLIARMGGRKQEKRKLKVLEQNSPKRRMMGE